VNSLPKTVTRQRRDCDLNPGLSAPQSSTLTTRLPSHPRYCLTTEKDQNGHQRKHIVSPLVCFLIIPRPAPTYWALSNAAIYPSVCLSHASDGEFQGCGYYKTLIRNPDLEPTGQRGCKCTCETGGTYRFAVVGAIPGCMSCWQ